ncbi:hypothetical protein CL657_02700 [bacterium]|nr:hypothetical protein [bacterium]
MSQLFIGSLFHKRFYPKVHQFTYPAFFFGLDCDDLKIVAKKNLFFSYNRFNLFSIHDKDYLKDTNQSIADKVRTLLLEQGYKTNITTITLFTSTRCLGYCFNPVSFYYCYHNDTLTYIIAEVNNTFKERHPYILTCDTGSNNDSINVTTTKEFYVSPFFDVDGTYHFKFSPMKDVMRFIINYNKQDKPLLYASLSGRQHSLTSLSLLKLFFTFPWTCFATFSRILFQAFRLKFKRKLPIKQKIKILHKHSMIIKKPSIIQLICKKLVLSRLKLFKDCHLSVQFPNGITQSFGNPDLPLDSSMWIKDYQFFSRVVFRQEIGLGESFMLNEWEADNVKTLLLIFLKNLKTTPNKSSLISYPMQLLLIFQHFLNRNHIINSKKNIGKHYDLSNDFFKCFLDETMMYSCAFYPNEQTTLNEAQKEKINKIIQGSDIKPGMRVLEIGSGWGAIAIELASHYNCHVTTVTISKEQFSYVKTKINELGLADKITLLFQDYRHLEGVYDRIISIEMLEAVGHKFLPVYFNKINDLLTDSGKAFIQSITIKDDIYDTYKANTDWIRKYIFPGGHLPSIAHIKNIIQHTKLSLTTSENIGMHYVKTLDDWKIKFLSNLDHVKSLGFDDLFIRKWLYYFEYCQAGFSANHIQDYHLVFHKQ